MTEEATAVEEKEMPEMKVIGKKDREPDGPTLGKLSGYAQAGVFARFGNIDFKARTSLMVAKFLRCVQEEMKDLDDQRKKLGEKYGEKETDEAGNEAYSVKSPEGGGDQEKWDAFKEEMEDLSKHPVDLSAHSFKIHDFKTGGRESDIPSVVLQMLLDFDLLKE